MDEAVRAWEMPDTDFGCATIGRNETPPTVDLCDDDDDDVTMEGYPTATAPKGPDDEPEVVDISSDEEEIERDNMGRGTFKGPGELVQYDEVCAIPDNQADTAIVVHTLKKRTVPEITNKDAKRFLNRAKDYYIDYFDVRTSKEAKREAFTNARRLYGIFGICQLMCTDNDWCQIVHVSLCVYCVSMCVYTICV